MDDVEQQCGVLRHIFNLSQSLEKVPTLWKMSILQICLMETNERLIFSNIRHLVRLALEPLWLARRTLKWITLSFTSYNGFIPTWTRLSTVTIQLLLLGDKVRAMQ